VTRRAASAASAGRSAPPAARWPAGAPNSGTELTPPPLPPHLRHSPPPPHPTPQGAPPPSPLDPLLARFGDGALMLGDCVMIAATEASSDRVGWAAMPVLGGVLLGSWLLVAVARGDYAPPREEPSSLAAMLGLPALVAITDAMLTWALTVPCALAAYAGLVSSGSVPPELMLHLGEGPHRGLAPQMEVVLATVITLSAWRGIAARLRS